MSNNKFFYENDERKNGNSKNINVTAFKEQLSLTLFSELYCLNMKILDYWYINIKVIRIKYEPGGSLCKCWLQKYVTHFMVVKMCMVVPHEIVFVLIFYFMGTILSKKMSKRNLP